ncbi:hypothetical protein B566_EDAN014004 [Ephemera danica]|nr:hypothetical protein B566_EDAN014004 [Ephemera danica]
MWCCCSKMDNQSDGEESKDECAPFWAYLPDTVLLQIFQFLKAPDLLQVSQVCHSWYRVGTDEFLWRDLLHYDYGIDKTIGLAPGRTSYKDEYYRLIFEVPIMETEIIQEHAHQVLHVSFSHNGEMFATCSKDGEIFVWNSKYPVKVKYHRDMKTFSWKYTQYSQFNSTDTLLLVSGVHFGTPNSTSGEIAVFSLQGGFELQCRMANKPYDIFGTWYNDHYLLSGDLYWLANLVSTSVLWLNKASQESSSEHTAIMKQLFRFYNRNASSVRAIMVADCLAPEVNEPKVSCSKVNQTEQEEERSGNPPSQHAHQSVSTTRNSVSPYFKEERAPSPSRQLTKDCAMQDFADYASPIQYKEEYRLAECESKIDGEESDSSMGDEAAGGSDSLDTEDDEDADHELLEHKDKFLIFTTGSKTFTPHQIERLAERDRQAELEKNAAPRLPEPNWLDYDSVADKFHAVDHLIDLHGHIIGMGLSPDHRFLYVNSRPWPQNYEIRNPLDPPQIAQEIDIHVIDLVSLKEVGTMLRAHKAYTPNNECFFIFLDVCNEYVASGAEDRHGYLWDRHYGTCLAKFPHDDVVNSVAFNPCDPEMLVTVSDDFAIKVWRSRRKVKELSITFAEPLPMGIELRRGSVKPVPKNPQARSGR